MQAGTSVMTLRVGPMFQPCGFRPKNLAVRSSSELRSWIQMKSQSSKRDAQQPSRYQLQFVGWGACWDEARSRALAPSTRQFQLALPTAYRAVTRGAEPLRA